MRYPRVVPLFWVWSCRAWSAVAPTSGEPTAGRAVAELAAVAPAVADRSPGARRRARHAQRHARRAAGRPDARRRHPGRGTRRGRPVHVIVWSSVPPPSRARIRRGRPGSRGALGVRWDTRAGRRSTAVKRINGESSGRGRVGSRADLPSPLGDQPVTAASTSSPYSSSLRAPMPGSADSSRRFAGRVSAIACSVASVKTT